MAIKKLTEFQSGYTAEYYQLARIEWNKGSAMLVTFNVFKDKQARLDNKLPLTQVTVQLDVAPLWREPKKYENYIFSFIVNSRVLRRGLVAVTSNPDTNANRITTANYHANTNNIPRPNTQPYTYP
jgi:hypothetical protein